MTQSNAERRANHKSNAVPAKNQMQKINDMTKQVSQRHFSVGHLSYRATWTQAAPTMSGRKLSLSLRIAAKQQLSSTTSALPMFGAAIQARTVARSIGRAARRLRKCGRGCARQRGPRYNGMRLSSDQPCRHCLDDNRCS